MTKNSDGWASDVKTGIRLITVTGVALSAIFLLGFGAWAALAPLASAAVAPGVVAAAGKNQGGPASGRWDRTEHPRARG
ncbi:hypothetical protein [Aurantimonas sp. A3-2-R12]|uniref:hypothetical protein n=1 Tax=Aurantimonas sp. A3-2-R12 TaxID=3114362 RepID=UPI002E194C32|nr:hypothetical protein [Aurantimonas sp. A3-2-R12]